MKIGKRAFLLSAGIILILMMFSGILTLILPAGRYERETVDGHPLVVNGSNRELSKPDYPLWRWLTAAGGSIAVLEYAGIMEGLVRFLVAKFSRRKYLLIAVICFFFMVLAAFVGIYEGMVPMIIFIIPIAISLGWDSLTGLGMSLLPLSFGFAAAVTNPFTIAQRIADLPLFSGALLQLSFFCVIYVLVVCFVIRHAKKVEANPASSLSFEDDEALRQRLAVTGADAGKGIENRQWRALLWFVSCIAVALLIMILTARSPTLSALAFPAMNASSS
ncbi:MAG: hypothetical protein Pg6C_00910 [Treponemataceae bacterium]|nr:MAG: hypothetical protein Pg6C_00910 [Treponemataceae bacterium]